LGVYNDVNAMIELKMRGETSPFPLTLDPRFFSGDGEVDQLARRMPLDNGWNARPEPRRILGSIPIAELSMLPLPALREDLEVVGAAWESGTLTLTGSRVTSILIVAVIGGFLVVLWLLRRRQRLSWGKNIS
jgi:hypothetical protein